MKNIAFIFFIVFCFNAYGQSKELIIDSIKMNSSFVETRHNLGTTFKILNVSKHTIDVPGEYGTTGSILQDDVDFHYTLFFKSNNKWVCIDSCGVIDILPKYDENGNLPRRKLRSGSSATHGFYLPFSCFLNQGEYKFRIVYPYFLNRKKIIISSKWVYFKVGVITID